MAPLNALSPQIHRCVERGAGADSEYARERASQNSTIVYGARWTFYGAVAAQLRNGYFYIAGYIGHTAILPHISLQLTPMSMSFELLTAQPEIKVRQSRLATHRRGPALQAGAMHVRYSPELPNAFRNSL
jgi:hypothetical protein